MKVVILNAPAMAGKDYLYKTMSKTYRDIHHVEFKEALVDFAVRASGMTRDLWDALYTRTYKEVPTPYLMINGKYVSPREWLIHISEKVVKPIFGQAFFGERAAAAVASIDDGDCTLAVFTDGGFPQETLPLMDLVGKDNLYIVRLRRKNPVGDFYSFADTNDSRNYLSPSDFPKDKCPVFLDVENINGDPLHAVNEIYSKVFNK